MKSKSLLTFGIDYDWSFEKHFLEINDCFFYGYDGTLNENTLIDKNIFDDYKSFFKNKRHHINKNIGKNDNDREISVTSLFKNKADNIFLKCDIEGAEYNILHDILLHSKLISGMVIEFHDIHDFNKLNEMINFVGKLDQKLIHTHINNYFYFYDKEFYIPSVIELSFTSSQNIELKENIQLPNDLDMPNCSDREEFKIVF